MFALLCPGQGSQTPGMLTPWLEGPRAAAHITEWSRAAGVDLAAHGTRSDAATIRDTAIAQPLIVATSLLAFHAAADAVPAIAASRHPAPAPRSTPAVVVAGHSVGEFTAAAIAGILTPTEAVALVAERGRAMAACAAAEPTGMTAVIGGDPDAVLAAIRAAGLIPANINGAGQVVAAGPRAALATLEACPPAGARVRRLDVAGAFHTPSMAGAQERLARSVAALPPRSRATTTIPLVSCRDGAAVHDTSAVLTRLVDQVTAPVRWDLVMRTMASLPLTCAVELAPAGVLTGLARRELPGPARVKFNGPGDGAHVNEAVAA
ncbi:MAG: ACP S-malonyltransferase [Bifidobacteriaceae bacterium]|nr:ACP S-malonyltransferase [Bifidobacteriaceae bacterium]